MFIYIASSEQLFLKGVFKIGCTIEPHSRLSTYLTGCPPDMSPSQDIEYVSIWETTAKTRNELFDHEEEVHNQFLPYRVRADREWFKLDSLEKVTLFVKSREWFKQTLELSEIKRPKREYLRQPYYKNLSFKRNQAERLSTLNLLQEPVIQAISSFLLEPSRVAGYVVAPCGTGKTMMTVKSMGNVGKTIICVPSQHIQKQWRETLVEEKSFDPTDICLVGTLGTTDADLIKDFSRKERFCILSTYMSSHLLCQVLTSDIVLICDEAHHMAGIVSDKEDGEGLTRKLLSKASEMSLKRLFLTYTPRLISNRDSSYFSMDDEKVFGEKIIELNIRDLINKGVLPDYRVWSLRDASGQGKGLLAKAECILDAWTAKETTRGIEQYILHHLIVFAQTTQEAMALEEFFKVNCEDTAVFRVTEGDDVPIQPFTEAKRAILVNCFVLAEGVDIPIANAVAITYPKQSRSQITQMVLRAGRWYENKPVFHVLIPSLGDEDLSGFEEVLLALATGDRNIRDEIFQGTSTSITESSSTIMVETVRPQCIVIDTFHANTEEIKRCFSNLMRGVYGYQRRQLQEFCMERGVSTSIDYHLLRQRIPDMPEDPRRKQELWYDYLHPYEKHSMTRQQLVQQIIEPNQLKTAEMYEEWRSKQKKSIPSIQEITDGVFGKEYTNFNLLGGQKVKRR